MRIATCFFLIWIYPLLNGCMDFGKEIPEKRFFMLDVSRQGPESRTEGRGVLKVRRFRISPEFDGKGFVYQIGPTGYESDYYNEFFIPPAEMITEKVREWLEGSGLFKNVVRASSGLEANYLLEGEILSLYGDYREGAESRAALKMQLRFFREAESHTEVIFSTKYQMSVPLKEKTPEELVSGWNEGLRQILTALESEIKGHGL